MTVKALTRTRQRLLSEHENVIRLIGRGRLAVEEFDLDKADEGDFASTSHDRELLYKLYEVELARLRVVGDAMKAMDRGEFGKCIVCAEDIGENRLSALPWAAMCVRCQAEKEAEDPVMLCGHTTPAELSGTQQRSENGRA